MVRKQVTSRFRGTDMFSRRIVIVISRTGLALIIFSVACAAFLTPVASKITAFVSLITALVAAGVVIEARHQLRTFKYEAAEKLASRLTPEKDDESDSDLVVQGTEGATERYVRLSRNGSK